MATKTIKGTSVPYSELNPYGVGLLRLSEIHVSADKFERDDIEYIGRCSINHRKVILGRIGNDWVIAGRAENVSRKVEAQFNARLKFRAHYVIIGKRVTMLHEAINMTAVEALRAHEYRERSKPLSQMTAQEIFRIGQGEKPKPKRAPKMRLKTRIANSFQMERFTNPK